MECGVDPRKLIAEMWTDVSSDLLRLASSMGMRPDQAEDIVQNVFYQAWNQATDCSSPDELVHWLIRVTINESNLVHRRRQRWRNVWMRIAVLRNAFGSSRERRSREVTHDDQEAISLALDELPADQRSVLVLRYIKGYDSTVIGRILGVPPSTIRGQLRRVRKALASKLAPMGFYDE